MLQEVVATRAAVVLKGVSTLLGPSAAGATVDTRAAGETGTRPTTAMGSTSSAQLVGTVAEV